jgi:hypothetical protein
MHEAIIPHNYMTLILVRSSKDKTIIFPKRVIDNKNEGLTMKKHFRTIIFAMLTFLSSLFGVNGVNAQAPEPPSYSPPINLGGTTARDVFYTNLTILIVVVIIIVAIVCAVALKLRKRKASKNKQAFNTKFCSSCGSPIDNDSAFCKNCGKKVS